MTNVIQVNFNSRLVDGYGYKLDDGELIDTSFGFINNERVNKPKTRYDYQLLLKSFLCQEDYEEIMVCIMDHEYYGNASKEIKNIVNCYFSLPVK